MKKVLLLGLFVVTGTAMAAIAPEVPEIDGSSAASALALLSGALMILRGRRRN